MYKIDSKLTATNWNSLQIYLVSHLSWAKALSTTNAPFGISTFHWNRSPIRKTLNKNTCFDFGFAWCEALKDIFTRVVRPKGCYRMIDCISKQACIPVGCVPSASVAISTGGWGEGRVGLGVEGVCLWVRGGGVCLWVWGECLPPPDPFHHTPPVNRTGFPLFRADKIPWYFHDFSRFF